MPRTYAITVFALLAYLPFTGPAQAQADGPKRLRGICYGPYRDNETPHDSVFPLPSELEKEIAFVAGLTPALRTYSVSNSHYLIPEICEQKGIDCYPGAWLGRSPAQNDLEIELLLRIANRNLPHVKGLLIGNEPLHRGDFSEAQYLGYIQRVKQAVKVPVTVGESWHTWMKYPKLGEDLDFLIVHVYPYWDNVAIARAAPYTLECLDKVQQQYPTKRLVLGEFGWPSAGETRGRAVAGPEQQARYLREVLPLLEDKHVDYFYFALWDERWKERDEGAAGPHWGLFNADGTVKPKLVDLLPGAAAAGLRRPPRAASFPK